MPLKTPYGKLHMPDISTGHHHKTPTKTALVAIEVGLNGLLPTYNTGFRTPRSTPRRLSARYYTSSEASGETNSVTINRCLMGQLVWSGILGQMGWVDISSRDLR